MSFITIPLDKSIDSFVNLVNQLAIMDKRKQDKALRFIRNILISIAIFLIVVFWAFGHFILAHPLW